VGVIHGCVSIKATSVFHDFHLDEQLRSPIAGRDTAIWQCAGGNLHRLILLELADEGAGLLG